MFSELIKSCNYKELLKTKMESILSPLTSGNGGLWKDDMMEAGIFFKSLEIRLVFLWLSLFTFFHLYHMHNVAEG